ncbi:TrkH family potassium uptake protein [Roseomonas genomospecies 6]|uniref:Trk system potassium uptake protein n=1 Tax=Roseomonas genomospecies 6 TaxID=214106 RepID=A0A9W7TYN4_9PROT|nr:TrkH family potassium uptake protein [Roseomonas genomospecies 6]KAA0679745.1 TrkH family potassium uptake protein [Roseomonas genomospecies 6]
MTVIDTRPVFYIIGALLSVLAVAMLVPMTVDLAVGNPDWMVFAIAFALTLFFGVQFMLANRMDWMSLNLRQAFLLTALAWIIVCAFAAVPFMVSQIKLSAADAYFEAMSALTTTGSTVISGLDRLPPGLLLWRSLLQWLGGIGIIGMAIAILPFLRVGGMQLFRSESSDRSDKVTPRASDLAIAVGWIYLSLTAVCTVTLAYAGMTWFDAVNHAMTAVSTGGFSTRDASVAAWNSPAIEWILVVFMMLGGMPFVRFISLAQGRAASFWRDTQIRWYVGFLAAVSFGLSAWLTLTRDMPWDEAIRHSTFNVVSVVTTTGYASIDYERWGPMASVTFFILTFVGGCTGSTSGGLKIFRFEILFIVLRSLQRRLYSPSLVIPLSYNDKPVSAEIMVSVMSFGFVYLTTVFILAFVLAFLGVDLVSALSGAATAVSNVGPGLGPVIGPVGNFATLPEAAKWALSIGMLLGRLEFFTVLVVLSPSFWRR